MTAIMPRKTVEQIVADRDETLRLYELAFGEIEKADAALKQAALMWKEATPGTDGRYYEGSKETSQFFSVLTMPDRDQWLATARRLVDISVWQHVVEISGIEALMDREEKDKLRSQMRYRKPCFKGAKDLLETLSRYVEWVQEDPSDVLTPARHFRNALSKLQEDPETFEGLGDDGVNKIREMAAAMTDALSQGYKGSYMLQDITTTVDEFEALLANPKGLPAVSVDNILATIHGLVGQSNEIFMRGLVNSFTSLDRRFRSHDGFKIGSRVIIDRLCSPEHGHINYGWKEDTLVDIERIFTVLDGRKPGAIYGSIVSRIRDERGWKSEQTEHEGDYFRVRIFKNGNAHLWFTRKDLVEKVNKKLAEYYGEVVADGMTKADDPLKNVKTTPAKNHGFFPTPDALADLVFKNINLHRPADLPRMRILEPSAGTGQLARRCLIDAATISKRLGEDWHERFRLDHFVDCIEVQPQLAAQLEMERTYRRVTCADFLQVQPDPYELYDLIVMNPPFDRERDIDHVNHALRFLAPGGSLVAIMSAGTEFRETKKSRAFRELVASKNGVFDDLPAGSFASVGTYVNTVLLRLNEIGTEPGRFTR